MKKVFFLIMTSELLIFTKKIAQASALTVFIFSEQPGFRIPRDVFVC